MCATTGISIKLHIKRREKLNRRDYELARFPFGTGRILAVMFA